VLYSCFTQVLLLLYSCFTLALLRLYSGFTRVTGFTGFTTERDERLGSVLLAVDGCYALLHYWLCSCFTGFTAGFTTERNERLGSVLLAVEGCYVERR
jgi:hypothetical protein